MTASLAVFGITDDTINTVVQLLLLVLVVIWLALIFYTFADARRRIGDPILVACATAASLFPFVGTVIYMIVRPPEFLEDVHERELEMHAAEISMHSAAYLPCPHCDYPVGRDYLRCPSCLRKLRDKCTTCEKPLDPDWRICPYCEAEIEGVTPPPRRRRSGKTGETDAVADDGQGSGTPTRRRRGRAAASSATGDNAAVADASGSSSGNSSGSSSSGSGRRRRSGSGTTGDNAAVEPAPRRPRTGTTQNTEALKPDEAMAPRRPRTPPAE
jgi:hypothetical protein